MPENMSSATTGSAIPAPALTAAGVPRLEAPIVAVEVFRSSAIVHRRGTLPVSADGPVVVEVAELPLALLDGSVRAAVAPLGACAIAELQVAIDVAVPVEEQTLPEHAAVERLQREHRALQQARETAEEELAQILRLQPIVPPPPRGPDGEWFPADDPTPGWLALMGMVRELAGAHQERLRDAVRRLRGLRDELRRAEEVLAGLSTAHTSRLRVGKKVTLRLDCPPQQPCTVELSYQVRGARWVPTYALRVDPRGTGAELAVSALLGQVTGEDWPAVQLALSTADLHRRTELPELPALRIGRPRAPARRPAWRPLPDDLEQLFADFDAHRPPEQIGEPGDQAVTEVHRAVAPFDGDATHEYRTMAGCVEASAVAAEWEAAELSARAYVADEITHDDDEALDAPTLGGSPPAPAQRVTPARSYPAVAAPPPPPSRAAPAPPASRAAPAPQRLFAPSRAEPDLIAPLETSEVGIPPARSALGEELLAFAALVLPDADAPDRGTLRPAARHELLSADDTGRTLAALAEADAHHADAVLQLRTRPLPPGTCAVEQSAGHFAHRYTTEAPARIPADGELHRVPIARAPVPVDLSFRTVPRVEPTVYRVAALLNPLTQPLLAGPLDVFWGNDFLVTARLETTAAQGPIELTLGAEPRIKVARNAVHSEHEAGLLAGRVVYEEQIDIELRSGMGHPCTVDVLERIPVSDEKKLEVKLLEEQPRGAEYTQHERLRPIRGGRRYRLQLGPGAQQRVRLRYAMTLPASNEIAGGGRRA
jgi:hypothetical protein